MESSKRQSVRIEEAFCVVCGSITSGLNIVGPYNEYNEALKYCETNVKDIPWEITKIRKEIVEYE